MAEIHADFDSVLGSVAQDELLDHVRLALGSDAAVGLVAFQSLFSLEAQLQQSLGTTAERMLRTGIERIKTQVLSSYNVEGFGIKITCVQGGQEGLYTGWIGNPEATKTRIVDLQEVVKVNIS